MNYSHYKKGDLTMSYEQHDEVAKEIRRELETIQNSPGGSTQWLEEHIYKKPSRKLKDGNQARPGQVRIDADFFADIKVAKQIRADGNIKSYKQSPLGLYLFLRKYVWTDDHPKDIYRLYHRYYLKGILASTYAMTTLAEIFGVSEKCINDWLKKLRCEGAIKYGDVKVGRDQQNVYFLGTIDEYGFHNYYADK